MGTVASVGTAIGLLVLGAVLLTAGAEAFAEHVATAAARLGVSVLALGLLLAGAEPEEAVTAMVASAQSQPGLAAGDAIGANLIMLTLALGLSALLAPLPVDRRVVRYAAAAALTGAVTFLLLTGGVLSRFEGLLLLFLYVAGVAWVWRRERIPPLVGELGEITGIEEAVDSGVLLDEPEEPEEPEEHDGDEPTVRRTRPRSLALVLLGLAAMIAGGLLAVHGARLLVDLMNVSESAIGLTLLALATSAEMVALVWASHRRGITDVVLAGAVGSVAYNATVSIGLAAVVRPLYLPAGSPVPLIALVTAVLPLLLAVGLRTGRLSRVLGAGLVVAYGVATAWILTR